MRSLPKRLSRSYVLDARSVADELPGRWQMGRQAVGRRAARSMADLLPGRWQTANQVIGRRDSGSLGDEELQAH
ncbi:unnamed protein product, partial [Nesidiocoris tenuis]